MKTLVTITMILAIAPVAFSQTMYVYTSGGSSQSFPISQIDSITFSIGGQYIVYTVPNSGGSDIYRANIDGSNPINLTNDPAHVNAYPQVSPSGDKVAFASNRSGQSDIWIVGTDGSNLKQLTTMGSGGGHNQSGSVTWINDHQLIYTHTDSLIRINLDGTGATPIALVPPGWIGWHTVYASRDGSKLASNAQGSWGYNQQVYVMNSDGTDMRVVVPNGPGGEMMGSFSPDGKKLLYQRSFNGAEDGSGYDHIFVVDLADTSNRIDLSTGLSAGYTDSRPFYSPDGSKIYFDNMAISPVAFSIWVMDANGSNRQQIISSGWGPFVW